MIVISVCSMLDGLGNAYANWLPQYYSQQLDYDLESTGIMIALPMLIGVISAALGGLAADAVLSRGYAVSSVRRYALRTQLLRPTAASCTTAAQISYVPSCFSGAVVQIAPD